MSHGQTQRELTLHGNGNITTKEVVNSSSFGNTAGALRILS